MLINFNSSNPSSAVWGVRLKVMTHFYIISLICLEIQDLQSSLFQYVAQSSWTNDIKTKPGLCLTIESLMLSYIKGRKEMG